MASLQGKVALITGGSSGIGRAAAIAFAREGARVVIAARGAERGKQVESEIRASGGNATFVTADVSRPADVASLVDATVVQYGRLDCCFNNAAELIEPRMTADYDEAEFYRAVASDLKSVWLCMKREIQQMLAQNPAGGAIVNTSSVNGLGGVALGSLYAMSKAGVVALTKSAALEYASRGIRVNALVAGAFDTPMLASAMDRATGGDPSKRAEIEAAYKQFVAIGRIGNPAEAAEAAMWLCSDAASYVTGHSMIVDGGMTAPYR